MDVRRGTARSWRDWPAAPTGKAADDAGEPSSGPSLLFTALEVQALAIQELLR